MKTKMSNTRTRGMFAMATIIVAMAGCATDHRPHIDVNAHVDVSSPDKGLLDRYGMILYRAQRTLSPQAALSVSAFAGSGQTVYTGKHLSSKGAFNEKVGSELLKSHTRQRTFGTHPERVLANAAANIGDAPRAVVLLIVTDGGVEDQSQSVVRSITESVEKLRRSRRLRAIVVLGVLPQHRATWEAWLSPLKHRAVVRGLNDCDGAIDKVLATTAPTEVGK
jgi:hypothetical protein